MVGFDLTIVNFALLLLTAYLSVKAHLFQVRTSIRESLEQIDHFEVHKGPMLHALLHDFDYGIPILSRFGFFEPTAEVILRSKSTLAHEAIATRVMKWERMGNVELEDIKNRIEDVDAVDEIEIDDIEIRLTLHSRNPVTIRRATVDSMLEIRESVKAQRE